MLSPSFPRSGEASPTDGVQVDYRGSPQGSDRSISSYASVLSSQAPSPNFLSSPHLAKRRFRFNSFLSGGSTSPGMDSHTSPGSASARSITEAASAPVSQLPPAPRTTDKILSESEAQQKSRQAQRINNAMVYLEGPVVYTCGECRTHLTSHDDIVSKSFHGRHGRAYLLDHCVNVRIGPAEERRLMTGLHSVCDIFCNRCNTLVGWTYKRAFESSQKYKEGKFIVEKIHIHPEEGSGMHRGWRKRSLSLGSSAATDTTSLSLDDSNKMVYEY